MTSITINHVLSSDVHSQIFEDILGYFKRHARRFDYVASEKALAGALIRHYHRPNLESDLITPAVVTVHHDLDETDEWLHFSNYERQYRQADLIVCLNLTQKRKLAELGIDRTVVIPHGFNNRFLTPVAREFDGERKLVLGMFSRRYPRKVKGEAYFQELMQRLDPDRFSFFLVGKDRGVEARVARSLGFEARVYERLPYPVLCDAYRAIDMLLVASRFEGGPANVPEALATCTPMATTRVGMAADMVEQGVNGIFLSLDAAHDAQALMDLHREPERVNALYAGAASMRPRAITWADVIARHEGEYARMLHSMLEVTRG